MPTEGTHHTTHQIYINAPVDVVYRIIADAVTWPQHFTPTVHVDRSVVDDSTERLRIWASANGEVKDWTSLRVFDRQTRTISFRQEVSAPPIALMGGKWIVSAGPGSGTTVVLTHHFDAVDDDPASVSWIAYATNSNSDVELANIKALAERWQRMDQLLFTFDDSIRVRASRKLVYDFLYRAEKWPDRLPHVARLDLREDGSNVQHMSMDTKAMDGSTHTTESVRVCFPDARIVYKQLVPPALLSTHTGEWVLQNTGDGVLVTSRHAVVLNESNICAVLGADATPQLARDFVRRAISGNSHTTLSCAKVFAETCHA